MISPLHHKRHYGVLILSHSVQIPALNRPAENYQRERHRPAIGLPVIAAHQDQLGHSRRGGPPGNVRHLKSTPHNVRHYRPAKGSVLHMSPRPGPRRPSVTIRMTADGRAHLDAMAKLEGVNRSEMIRILLAEAVKARQLKVRKP